MRAREILREDGSCERYSGVVSAVLAIVDEQWLHQTPGINRYSAASGKLRIVESVTVH